MRHSLVWFVLILMGSRALGDEGWTRFRGPNGSGVSLSTLPEALDLESTLAWKVAFDPGYSSPILRPNAVLLTAHTGLRVYLRGLARSTGEVLFEADCPEPLAQPPRGPNSPAASTPATDGTNSFVFFPHFGLVSYDADGKERWNRPLGPFNNPYGMGTSPVLADGKVLLQCDQDTSSYLIAVDANSGEELWRQPRPGTIHGFSSPVIYRPDTGAAQAVLSGSYQVCGYSLADGERRWWVDGMAWQAKTLPILLGHRLFVSSWMASPAELGLQKNSESWEEVLARCDGDSDQRLSREEAPDPAMPDLWFLYDLDKNGFLDAPEWAVQRARATARNGLYAIDLEGDGDLTPTQIRWQVDRALPNIPSPLLYQGVLYLVKEGGIFSALDPATGEALKQGRIEGAMDPYYASPVAADGKILTASHPGRVAVLRAGADWEVLQVLDLGEEIWATPAVDDGQVIVRTQKAVYCFES